MIFGHIARGVWFYNVLDLGALLDGGILVWMMLFPWRHSMLVLFQCLDVVSRHGEVYHSSPVVPVETHYAETFPFPIY